MPSCVILYHYYYPDDVVSARHFTDFAEGLAQYGWNVQVFTSNKYCRKKGYISRWSETHHGVFVRRFKHPPLPESKNIYRLLNCFLLSTKWFFALLFLHIDVAVLGTDPQFLFFIIPILKIFRPKIRLALWGFDLYPEAIIADDIKMPKIIEKLLFWWAGISYRCCGLLVDIGSCMSDRLSRYNSEAKYVTIIPWALKEPQMIAEPDAIMRSELFGETKLGLLYSGTIGKAHQFEEFILLARELRRRNASVTFCFAGRGNRYQELRDMVTPEDTNITFAGFIEEEKLSLRLAAADMHMISLRHGWEGVSVPSKFFGSLAAGRPLLYCGTQKSCIAKLIANEKFGFVIDMNTITVVADKLEEFTHNKNKIHQMQKQIFQFYNTHFSKRLQWEKWNRSLRDYIKVSN